MNALRIFLNKEEITHLCLWLGDSIIFHPPNSLPLGKNIIEIKTNKGQQLGGSEFFIADPKLIESIVYLGEGIYYEGDSLKAILKGKPGGLAYFSVGEEIKNLPMQEIKPGLYQGIYQVKLGDYQSNASVIGKLVFPNGQEEILTNGQEVNIYGQFFKIKLINPQDGVTVGINFEIKGITQPNSEIRIYPQLSHPGFSSNNDKVMKSNVITAKSDAEGYFSVLYGLPIKIPGLKLKFELMAIDTQGFKSLPLRFAVTVK